MIRLLLRTASRELPVSTPVPADVSVRVARWLPAIAGRLSGMGAAAAAVTLGRTIIAHPNAQVTGRLIRHELAHVRQWQRYRWTFPVRYLINHFRYGYHANPFEVEARAAEWGGEQ